MSALLGGGGGLVPGTTPIVGGIDKAVLFDRAGVLGDDSVFLWDYTNHAILLGTGTASNFNPVYSVAPSPPTLGVRGSDTGFLAAMFVSNMIDNGISPTCNIGNKPFGAPGPWIWYSYGPVGSGDLSGTANQPSSWLGTITSGFNTTYDGRSPSDCSPLNFDEAGITYLWKLAFRKSALGTTDSWDVYSYITAQPPTTPGSQPTFTLPPDNGTSGWVLKTDGAGVTSWIAPGTASIVVGSPISGGTAGSVLFEDSSNNLGEDAAKFVWDDTNKQLVIGESSTTIVDGSIATVQAVGFTAATWTMSNIICGNHGGGTAIQAIKTRGANPASHTTVQNGDFIFSFNPYPSDGTSYIPVGFFGYQVDSAPGAGSVPTAFVVFTGSSAYGSEGLRVDSSQQVRCANDIYTGDATYLHRTTAALTNNAAGNTATLTNAPASGDPTKWIAIDDNGTPRFIPAW